MGVGGHVGLMQGTTEAMATNCFRVAEWVWLLRG